MSFQSGFDSKAWTGASGGLIGFAGDMPVTQPWGFVTDPIHGKNVNPNSPRPNAIPGPAVTGATDVIAGEEFVYEGGYAYDGMYGWLLDDIPYPDHGSNPGTEGHESSMGPAQARGHTGPDVAHAQDVFQLNQHAGYGKNFYGDNPLKKDLNAWASSSTPPPNTRQYPAQAREDTGNWPEPFNAKTVAPWRPVDESTEHIPMRRIAEDDRPIYRYIAVGPMNTIPTGNQWGVQYQSNVPIKNNTPIPMMPQTPVDPWITQEAMSATFEDSTDVFGGMSLQ